MRERNVSRCICPARFAQSHKLNIVDYVSVRDYFCFGSECACWLWTIDPDDAKDCGEKPSGRCGMAYASQDMMDDVTTE